MNKKEIAISTLIVTIVIVVILNFIVGVLGFGNFRSDLTEDELYTLDPATKNVVAGLKEDRQVKIRYFVSDDTRYMPPMLAEYGRSVEDFLLLLVEHSKGKLVLEKVVANPDTEQEDAAMEDDVTGQQVTRDKKIYLGLAIKCLQQKEVLPFLNPQAEDRLQYEIIRAVRKVSSSKQPVLGVLSSLPVNGTGEQQRMMMMMQQQQPAPPWFFVQRLKLDYEVKSVEPTVEKIPDDINTLLVLHPNGLSDQTEWAIDQFVLRGGKLLAFVDPHCLSAPRSQPPNPMMGGAPPPAQTSSNFKYLFKTWGINYDSSQVLADMTYARSDGGSNRFPTVLELDKGAMSSSDSATKQLRSVMLINSGAFSIEKKTGLTYDPMIESSPNSSMIDIPAAEAALRGDSKRISSGNKQQILALRVSGKFTSAFPVGKPPKAPAVDPHNPDKPPVEPPKDEPPEQGLKESKDDKGMVVLFSDVDMISDNGFLDTQSGMPTLTNSNLDLVLNVIEQLSLEGGSDLISVRSRASYRRAFTKINDMQEAIDEKTKPELERLEVERTEIGSKIGSLKASGGKIVMTSDQYQKFEDMQAKSAEIQKKIREVEKQRTKDMDQLFSSIKMRNLLIMPVVVGVLGIGIALIRRRRTAAA